MAGPRDYRISDLIDTEPNRFRTPQEEVLGLVPRVISALWFTVLTAVPILFATIEGTQAAYGPDRAWTARWLPVISTALCGFVFGVKILDPWSIYSGTSATVRGLMVAIYSYLLYLFAVSGLSTADSETLQQALSSFLSRFFLLAIFVTIAVGWLIAIAGAAGGYMLFRISRLPMFETRLLTARRVQSGQMRMMFFALFLLYCLSSVPHFYAERTYSNQLAFNARKKRLQEELEQAATNGDSTALARILSDGADPNYAHMHDLDTSLLSRAAESGKTDAVKVLLEHGADPNGGKNRDFLPLYWAAAASNREMTLLLLNSGTDVNMRGANGSTAIMGAAVTGSVEIAQLLMTHGADINARNNDGATPLTWARGSRERNQESSRFTGQAYDLREEMIAFLVKNGGVE